MNTKWSYQILFSSFQSTYETLKTPARMISDLGAVVLMLMVFVLMTPSGRYVLRHWCHGPHKLIYVKAHGLSEERWEICCGPEANEITVQRSSHHRKPIWKRNQYRDINLQIFFLCVCVLCHQWYLLLCIDTVYSLVAVIQRRLFWIGQRNVHRTPVSPFANTFSKEI